MTDPSARSSPDDSLGLQSSVNPADSAGLAGGPEAPIMAVEAEDPRTLPPPIPSGTLALGEEQEYPPVQWRELAAILLAVILADVTIYRGGGLAGYAALFFLAPLVMLLGAPRREVRLSQPLIAGMIVLLGAKMIWCGWDLQVFVGFALLAAFAMTLAGLRPYVLDIAIYAAQVLPAGAANLHAYRHSPSRINAPISRLGLLSVALPLAALAVFGTLFVLANPDLASSVTSHLSGFFRSVGNWLSRFSPTWQEILLWIVVAWITVGLFRPLLKKPVLAVFSREDEAEPLPEAKSPLYAAFRNTLAAVIALFAVYLVFEFKTLWFQEFPKGFYYAGYAHEGAAWLTLALALSTLVLSAIFRGSVFRDPRIPRLRALAWLWSAENLILALAVYNRMFIYVNFNGMTWMRILGLYGMTTVVVGFVLVVWKIAYHRDFVWLLQRHLWTLAIAVFLFSITPIDPIAHAYNVRRVLAGDLAPVVQISVHPISTEGYLVLPPLAYSDQPIIREGIRAMLAARAEQLEADLAKRERQGWTGYQVADQLLHEKLGGMKTELRPYRDPAKRAAALATFHEYAYQWY